jgi:hypothetical protein
MLGHGDGDDPRLALDWLREQHALHVAFAQARQ